MDPNLLAQLHGDDWLELSALAKKNTLTPEQTSRFLELYRTASKDLSRITTVAPDSLEAARLSAIVHRSRNHLSSVPSGGLSGLGRFFVISLPLSLYRLRWDFVIVAAGFLAVAVLSGIWAGTHPEVLETFGDREFRRQFAEHDFVDYYKENPNGFFAVGAGRHDLDVRLGREDPGHHRAHQRVVVDHHHPDHVPACGRGRARGRRSRQRHLSRRAPIRIS